MGSNLLQAIYAGVDHNLDGNGGPACASYISLVRRLIETIIICAFGTAYVAWGFPRRVCPIPVTTRGDRLGKRVLLVLMCLTFGCEIGFKLSTRTLIYLFNPCHVISAMQIYMLCAPPSRLVTVVFRHHIHLLNGAMLALAFPVLNTRLLPFEKEIYYIQHIMILVIPIYLIRIGGVYTVERIGDLSWSSTTVGYMLYYHFLVLQGIGLLTEVNLNNMLCPAISDPFQGQQYRLCAFVHQSLLIGLVGKLYVMGCRLLLTTICGHPVAIHHPDELHGAAASSPNPAALAAVAAPDGVVFRAPSEQRSHKRATSDSNVVCKPSSAVWSYVVDWCSLQAWRKDVDSNWMDRAATNGHAEHND